MAIAYVLITTAPGKDGEVHQRLLTIPEAREPLALFGEFDLICKLDAPDLDSLGQTILTGIRSIPGVVQTRTLMTTKL